MDLAALLRAARDESGLSQVEVARRAGVTPQALSRWESGSRPVRADDADRVLEACGRDARFALVLRHSDLDELLARLAATPAHERVAALPRLLAPTLLDELQTTGVVRFGGAWAAAALGLPALRPMGAVEVPDDPAAQAAVAAVLRPWNPVLVEDGQIWGASWDDGVLKRNPAATWSTALLGQFRIDVTDLVGAEHRVVVGDRSWRVVEPRRLVPDDVDAAALDRWSPAAT